MLEIRLSLIHILGNASDCEEYLHILAEEILQTAHRVLGRRGRVGVSRRTDRLGGLHAAYREAVEAAGFTPSEEGGVQFITDVHRGTPAAVEAVTACLEEVKAAFRAGDRDALCAGLSRMCSQQPGESTGPWLDAVAIQLMAEVYRVLEAGAGPEALNELDRRGLLPDLSFHYRNAGELRQALQDLCLGAKMCIRDRFMVFLFQSKDKQTNKRGDENGLQSIDRSRA